MNEKQKLEIAYQAMDFLVKAITAMEKGRPASESNYNLWRTFTNLQRIDKFNDTVNETRILK
jgi:hypothetical protein